MQRVETRPPRMAWAFAQWQRCQSLWQHIEGQPTLATRTLVLGWIVTRALLFAGLLIGHSYCDPEFYKYAGELAVGRWPYTPAVPVEYPPVAIALILLPALPLLLFPGIAPRPDPAFNHITHIPMPDPLRYGAYGISFAVEMLLIDALTLWLVQRAARRFIISDSTGLRSGLLYIVLVFLSGSILQKFDLATGTCCLIALVALASQRTALAWGALALATLIKGFPLLAIPVLIGYQLLQTNQGNLWLALRERARPLLTGFLAFASVIAAWTLVVVIGAGLSGAVHTILYNTGRGTEIESLYANGTLLIGWLPGLHAYTKFNPLDLSRIVKSSLDGAIGVVSVVVFALCLLLAYGTFARAVQQARTAKHQHWYADLQLAGVGIVAVLLAFELTFRALPAHYLLAILPIAVLLRLPGLRLQRLWLVSLFVIVVAGQLLTMVWQDLVLLRPWAVLILTLRNCAWVVAFGVLLVALWGWGRRVTSRSGVMS